MILLIDNLNLKVFKNYYKIFIDVNHFFILSYIPPLIVSELPYEYFKVPINIWAIKVM